jgi:hypothetical protein
VVLIRRDEGYWRQYLAAARTGLIIVDGAALLAVLVSVAPYVANNPSNYASANQQIGGNPENKNFSVFQIVLSGILTFGRWTRFHHDAIEAFSAFGGLLFSGVLTVSTIYLWRETRKAAEAGAKQAKLTRKSIKLARQEFTATHRPKLRVRNVVIDRPDPKNPLSRPFAPNQLMKGQLYVSNIGDSTAYIHESHVELWITDMNLLPMGRPYEGKDANRAVAFPISAGESRPLIIANDTFIPSVETADQIRTGTGLFVYVMGWVEYCDDNGVRRRMAFCRKYDHSLSRFTSVENPDYEHED